jgi:ketosteroid isomerase-like protein
MKRRNFIQHSLIKSGVFGLASNTIPNIFDEIILEQKINFMSELHPNLVLINAFFKAYSENNHDSLKNILSEDIKWHIPGNHPLSGTKIGIISVVDYFQKLQKGKFKAEPIVMGFNDNFVIDCHRNWSNVEEGDNLDSMSCLLWKIENHKIVEVFNFPQNQQLVDLFFSKLYK